MPSKVTMKQLLENGVHFGHRARKWNPRMREFIYTERNGVHIIDLQQTLASVHKIHDLVRDDVQRGGTVLFVGTKRQAQEAIEIEAQRCGMPYINQRWLGGTLTNWKTIRARIETLKRLERDRDEGIFDRLTKKERLLKQREIDRLLIRLGGIRNMERLPRLVYIIDVVREQTAVAEANSLRIPIIGLVDTNGDPNQIDHIIPGNDDAIRAIHLMTQAIADAVIEGQHLRRSLGIEEEVDYAEAVATGSYAISEIDDDEELLGAATLAKLREGVYFDDDDKYSDYDEDEEYDDRDDFDEADH
jgi:small subunit ribosomal protein S2